VTRKPVVRRRRANDDIQSAISFYLNQAGSEVAFAFVDRFEEAVKKISRQPAAGSQRFGHELRIEGLRQWLMKRFPYLIFYVEKEKHIEIARVLHTSVDITSRLDPDDAE
jgi:toxin ParE1/3/4